MTTYRVTGWRRQLMWWVLGPFLALGLGLALFDSSSRAAGGAILALMLPFVALWEWLVRRSRLELHETGIRLHDATGVLRVAWSEIVDLRIEPGHEGLVTGAPIEGKAAERLAAAAPLDPTLDGLDVQLRLERRFVPLQPFAGALLRGPLAADIARHAPHLRKPFDRLQRRPAAAPTQLQPIASSQHRAGRRRNVLVSIVVAGALLLSFVLIGLGAHAQAWFFSIAYALLDPLLALSTAIGAWQLLRRRQWLLGALGLAFALVLAGWTVESVRALHALATLP